MVNLQANSSMYPLTNEQLTTQQCS